MGQERGVAYSVLAHLVNRLPRPPETDGLPHIGLAVESFSVVHFRSIAGEIGARLLSVMGRSAN